MLVEKTSVFGRVWMLSIFTLALTTLSCTDETGPDQIAATGNLKGPSSNLNQQVEDAIVVGTRKVFRQWSSEIPGGFAGVYRVPEGHLVLMLTELTKAEQAKRAILAKQSENLLPSRRLGLAQVEVKRAQFSYTQLLDWYVAAWPDVWSLSTVRHTSIVQKDNVIEVGVRSSAKADDVRRIFTDLGIPEDAFRIREVGPAHSLTTLDDRIRPIPGGVEIGFNATGSPCSAGFNSIQNNSQWLFTASHCTNVMFSTGGESFYQPNTDASNDKFGNEIADAPTHDCSLNQSCAYADVAGIEYDDPAEADQGYIAKPLTFGSADSELEPHNEWFEINDDDSVCTLEGACAIVGDTLEKVGIGTGWTGGSVTDDCFDQKHPDAPDVTMICQATVFAEAGAGDSGSPVFEYIGEQFPSGNDEVALRGILWGGLDDGDFIYSKMVAIEDAFGTGCAEPQCQVVH